MELLLLWLLTVLLVPLVAAYDPSISNGTCYYSSNKKAAGNFIPCGNAAGGVQSCCQARDVCLSSNACFNGQYGVTYIAGCTDEDYSDQACPGKGNFPAQQWVGLVRCGVSSGKNEEWGPCQEPIQPELNKGNTRCVCDPSQQTAVFTDAATLTNIASLPVSSGNAILWYPGFTPSTTVTDSSTKPSPVSTTSSGISTGVVVTATVSASPSASPSGSGLASEVIAGIVFGSVFGLCAIVGLVSWIVYRRRKKNKKVAAIQDQIRPSSMNPWDPDVSRLNSGGRSPLGTRMWARASEMPTEANEVTTAKTSLGENTLRASTLTSPGTTYQAYQHSPAIQPSELDASPAGSVSGLVSERPAYEKPTYQSPIYELPG